MIKGFIMRIFLFSLLITFLTSCGVETYDSEKAYVHWENGHIGEDVEIINGQFWKSGHWTYEYVVFLELKPSKKWITRFFKIYRSEENLLGKYNSDNTNHLTRGPDWFETPNWFKPNSEFIVYSGYGGNYYWNQKENILLFYEMQL
ncbi:hypothetical protein HNV10_16845 [Winogradskyella litoriviva]|uniref:Lipoprotein n=1 Tax=Winogradskyella litoriviva TaxID=1220182 RepID=A0ABX2E9S7_9FLAO|nr:hypothetical protein [Winogradskyella litoriviva]NRD24925.1 hypothetical protein [Winogradskyella litoriviva]